METVIKKKDYRKSRKVHNGINIHLKSDSLINSTKDGLVITGITTTAGVAYYDMPVFIDKFKVSYSTISRNIDKLKYKRECWRYFVKIGNKNYVSCGVIGSKKMHTAHYTNVEYAQWLKCYHWDLVGSVRYIDSSSQINSRRTMERLFKQIKKKYYDKQIIFLFVTEHNPAADGYHNHFLLGYQSDIPTSEIKGYIESILRSKRFENTATTLIEPYHVEGDFIDYLVKQIHINKDGYDFLSNNLLN